MKRILILPAILAAAALGFGQAADTAPAPAPKPASELVSAAQKLAAREGKNLFVVFDASW